jgi:hypothetical protein
VSIFKKRTNLREIHKLYFLLKDALPEKEEEYLVNEVIKIMEKIDPVNFKKVMYVLRGDRFDFKNPGKIAFMFVEGIKKVSFFSYVAFMKSISK